MPPRYRAKPVNVGKVEKVQKERRPSRYRACERCQKNFFAGETGRRLCAVCLPPDRPPIATSQYPEKGVLRLLRFHTDCLCTPDEHEQEVGTIHDPDIDDLPEWKKGAKPCP